MNIGYFLLKSVISTVNMQQVALKSWQNQCISFAEMMSPRSSKICRINFRELSIQKISRY